MRMSHFLNTNQDQMKASQAKKIRLGTPNGVNLIICPTKVQEALSWTRCIINCKVDSFHQFCVKTILIYNFEENFRFTALAIKTYSRDSFFCVLSNIDSRSYSVFLCENIAGIVFPATLFLYCYHKEIRADNLH